MTRTIKGRFDEIKQRADLERQIDDYTGRKPRRCPLVKVCPQLRDVSQIGRASCRERV